MKKILLLITLITLASWNATFGQSQDDYTIMVYLNGSTLESGYDYITNEFKGHASKDLAEMIEGYAGDQNINIVIQTLGTKRWTNDLISGNETQRFTLNDTGLQLEYSMPNQNAGYKKGLSDFIIWSQRNYPANQYGLILWNHGGGPVKGFGLDEHFNGDVLHLEELAGALETAQSQGQIHFDFIGFDACLMASLEIAHSLAPYADYLMASEELEPNHGWNYTSLLKELHIEPNMSPETLGKIISDSYLAEAREKGDHHNITFSVIKLSEVKNIVAELELLTEFSEPIFKSPSNFYDFAKALSKARSFGGNTATLGYTDLIDIKDFANHLSQKLSINTDRLTRALETAVVYKIDGSASKNTGGLSLYFPLKDKQNYDRNMGHYRKIGFSETYVNFIDRFQDHINVLDGDQDIGYDLNPPNKQTDFYHIVFEDDDFDKISDVYLELMVSSPKEAYPNHSRIRYGYDDLVLYDDADTQYIEQFDKEWIHLNDVPLLVRITDTTDMTIDYESPVSYKDQDMYLLFSYDKEGDTYTINGLRRGIDPTTGKPDKEIYHLKVGDTIQAYYRGYHDKRRRYEWVKSDILTVVPQMVISKKDLEAENYMLAFRYLDYRYTVYQSDFFKFQR
jgi:hypothetical protein